MPTALQLHAVGFLFGSPFLKIATSKKNGSAREEVGTAVLFTQITEGGGSVSAVSQQNPGGGGSAAVFSITREEVDDRNWEEIGSIWEEVDAADLLAV